MKYTLILLTLCIFLSGCSKELSLETGQTAKPVIKYQLKAYYSDVPIDFVQNDSVVKQETDLWEYVYDYVKDDYSVFSDSGTDVVVYQNSLKMSGLEDSILYKTYSIGVDAEGDYIQFLGPDYQPFSYRLQIFTDDYFIIYFEWKPGINIYSRFEKVI